MSIEITQSNSATLDTFIQECVKNGLADCVLRCSDCKTILSQFINLNSCCDSCYTSHILNICIVEGDRPILTSVIHGSPSEFSFTDM